MKKYIQKHPLYIDLNNRSMARKEWNDCAVIAIAAAFELEYDTVLAVLDGFGREPGKATTYKTIKLAVGHFCLKEGTSFECLLDFPEGLTFNNIPMSYPGTGTYLVYNMNHIAAFINGRIIDWSAGRALRVCGLIKINRTGSHIEGIF